MSATTRTILFWLLMVALAVVLWKMADKGPGQGEPSTPMSYSDFMAQVDKSNVSSVRLLESPATAEVEGQLRDSRERFRTTIPKEAIPALTDELRKQGVPIDASEEKKPGNRDLIVNLAPFFVIVALWIVMFVMRSRRSKTMQSPPSATPTPTIPTNRRLG
jgi:ATP-dependent Zn protease